MEKRCFDFIIGEQVLTGTPKNALKNPYNGVEIGEVAFGEPAQTELAVESTCQAFPIISRLPTHKRVDILHKISDGIAKRATELAEVIRDEAGKPIQLARAEVERAIGTFAIASAEASRIEGNTIPLDTTAATEGTIGLTRRFPVGPVLAITPFNFPLNLVAHKVAPAIAAGNSILLKPASQTPMSALILAQIARESGLPPGGLNVIPCSSQVADAIVADPRLRMLTFTGSAAVGWELKTQTRKKRVVLELGGNAGAIVEPETDINDAAKRLAISAFAYAGQVCISVQRIFVHQDIASEFTQALLHRIDQEIICGDPALPDVICGPVIDSVSAERILEWIAEAHRHGADILCGGKKANNVLMPTVLTNVDPRLRIVSQEVFGPVVTLDTYASFDDAIARVNDSAFGLQASVFTKDTQKVWKAFRELNVGGIIHNNAPSFRTDHMPYGGIKESGFGREGVRYAIEEMTDLKLLALRE